MPKKYDAIIGTSGNQYKNAPLEGMMMSELIDKVENQNLDHDNHPHPFKLPETGISIDMSFFSRNREVNPESSFSVNS